MIEFAGHPACGESRGAGGRGRGRSRCKQLTHAPLDVLALAAVARDADADGAWVEPVAIKVEQLHEQLAQAGRAVARQGDAASCDWWRRSTSSSRPYDERPPRYGLSSERSARNCLSTRVIGLISGRETSVRVTKRSSAARSAASPRMRRRDVTAAAPSP